MSSGLLGGFLSQQGYDVSRLSLQKNVFTGLREWLSTTSSGDSLLITFAGYIALTEPADPALLISGKEVTSVGLTWLAKNLGARHGSAFLLLDTLMRTPVAQPQSSKDTRPRQHCHLQKVAQSMLNTVTSVDIVRSRPPSGIAKSDPNSEEQTHTVGALVSVRTQTQAERDQTFTFEALTALRTFSAGSDAVDTGAWFRTLDRDSPAGGARLYQSAFPTFRILHPRKYPSSPAALMPMPTLKIGGGANLSAKDHEIVAIPKAANLPQETQALRALAGTESSSCVTPTVTSTTPKHGNLDAAKPPLRDSSGLDWRYPNTVSSAPSSFAPSQRSPRNHPAPRLSPVGEPPPGELWSSFEEIHPEHRHVHAVRQESRAAVAKSNDIVSTVDSLPSRETTSDEAALVSRAREAWDAEEFESALEGANQCLARFPGSVDSLQIAASALTYFERWEQLSNLYARFIRSHPDRAAAAQLSVALSRICVGKLGDHQRALVAMQYACDQQPKNTNFQLETAAVAELAGDLSAAEQRYRNALELAPLTARVLRRAWAFYSWTHQTDAAWNAAALLCFSGKANELEQKYAERFRSTQLPRISRALSTQDFQRGLSATSHDPGLVLILSSLVPIADALSSSTMKQAAAILNHAEWVDAETSTLTVARALIWTAKLLNVPCPSLYLKEPEGPAQSQIRPTRILLPTGPAWAVPRGYGRGKTPAELAFFWATELSTLLQDSRILFTHPDATELRSLLEACYVASQLETSDDPDCQTLSRTIRKIIDRNQLTELTLKLQQFKPQKLTKRILAWHRQAERAAFRLGLLCCGDPELAARQIQQRMNAREDKQIVGNAIQESVEELAKYALGETYKGLRRDLDVMHQASQQSA